MLSITKLEGQTDTNSSARQIVRLGKSYKILLKSISYKLLNHSVEFGPFSAAQGSRGSSDMTYCSLGHNCWLYWHWKFALLNLPEMFLDTRKMCVAFVCLTAHCAESSSVVQQMGNGLYRLAPGGSFFPYAKWKYILLLCMGMWEN